MEILCTTGEFAKLCKVRKETLIFYDKVGVFKPRKRNEQTGYRYYAVDSIGMFVAINTLRKCGMSLQKISDFMNNRSTQNFASLIDEQVHIMENEINMQKQLQSMAEEKRELYNTEISFDRVFMELWDDTSVIASYISKKADQESTDNELEIASGMVEHIKMCEKLGASLFYIPDIILRKEDVLSKRYNRTKGYFSRLTNLQTHLSNHTIPGGDYMSICYMGHWKDSAKCYERLLDYAEKEHKAIIGDFYEQTILDAYAQDNQDLYVYKLSVMVK